MSFAQIGGLVLHHETRVGDREPAIAFVNSLGTDFRVWDAVMPRLGEGRTTLRHDKRGHGLSALGEVPTSIDELAHDLATLIDRQIQRPALIVGLSIGGMIAQALADRRPELVRGLVLMDTGHKIGTVEMWNNRIATVDAHGIAGLSDAILERWFAKSFHAERAIELAGWRHMLERTPVGGYMACSAAIRDCNLTERTRELRVPTLCMVGREDGSTPVALVRELHGLIADSELEIIENAGHLPCVEQPERVCARIERFIAERLS